MYRQTSCHGRGRGIFLVFCCTLTAAPGFLPTTGAGEARLRLGLTEASSLLLECGTCARLAAGLEEVFSDLFYDGKITKAACTKLQARTRAPAAIEYIRKEYGLGGNIPHVCIHVRDGVCLRGPMQGRFNPQTIAATTHALDRMLEANLWTQEEVGVITPYREQATLYRKVKGWLQIQVSTADSVQGPENNCTIFDIVLAYARIGGWGFVKEGLRLNVALSRPCDRFVLVCDPSALDPSERHQQQLDELEPEEYQERERAERESGKYLRGLFQHFKKKGMVYLEKAEALSEISLIDMTAVKEPRRRNACRNRQELGHKSEVHPNPRVSSITCHNCGEIGHRQSEYPTKTSSAINTPDKKRSICLSCWTWLLQVQDMDWVS